MESITITIETVNDVFKPNPNPELARILREIADKLDSGQAPVFARDANGNKVAYVRYD